MQPDPTDSTRRNRRARHHVKKILLLFAELVIAVYLSAALHPEIGRFIQEGPGQAPTPDLKTWLQYLLVLATIVVAEHAVLRCTEELLSGKWKTIQELFECEHTVPPGVIPKLAEALALPESKGRPKAFVAFLEQYSNLPAKARSALQEFLSNIAIHDYAEEVFISRIRKTQREMASLKSEAIFFSDLPTQYELASGLAKRFTGADLKTAYATFVEPPGRFYSELGRAYFAAQKQIVDIAPEQRDLFIQIIAPDIEVLKALCKGGDPLKHRMTQCTTRARIVVSSLQDLIEDLSKSESMDDFFALNVWHLENCFGLRYLILDDFFPSHAVVDLYARYSEFVGMRTYTERVLAIDDFIVYNESAVFGRTDPKYNNTKEVTLRMIHSETDAIHYKELFIRELWPQALSLGELWSRLKRGGLLDEKLEKKIKDVSSALVDRFQEQYADSLERAKP